MILATFAFFIRFSLELPQLIVRLPQRRGGLVTRVEVGQGSTRYEAARPDGHHHHHMVCDRCGEVQPFADEDLERAVDRLAARVAFDVAEHEIVLHGECAQCRN